MKSQKTPKTVLNAEGVSKSYGQKGNAQEVLQGINLRVIEGEFVGIMGLQAQARPLFLIHWLRLTVPQTDKYL